MDNIDIIERYLKGQLNAEEEKAFREQLKNDKAFRDEVLATALMIKQMKQQNHEKEKAILEEAESYKGQSVITESAKRSTEDLERVAKREKEEALLDEAKEYDSSPISNAAKSTSEIGRRSRSASRIKRPWLTRRVANRTRTIDSTVSHPNPHWPYWVSSIAAVLIIGFFAVKPIYFNYKSDQMISQNYAQWSPREEGTTKGASRGEVQAGENVIAELTELFDNVGKGKDMKMTTYRLEKALKESETDYEYYQYTADIVWYLALAYIQENQFGKARTALAAIIESEDPYYLERAEKLYKEIENMYFM